MPLAWFYTRPDGNQQLWIGTFPDRTHVRLLLPRPQWFRDVVRRSLGPDALQLESLSVRQGRQANIAIEGFLRFEPGTQYEGPLTQWGPQERLLHEYWRCPCDSFSMKVLDIRFLEVPFEVFQRHDVQERTRGLSRNTLCFFPVVDGLVDAAVAGTGGQSVSDVLYDMGLPDVVLTPECHACFCIPSLIAQLVEQGVWTHVLGLLRWDALAVQMPESWQLVEAKHEEPMDLREFELTAAKLTSHTNDIRRWAAAICGAHGEDERLTIEAVIRFFDGCSRAISGDGRYTATSLNGRKRVYDGAFLLHVLRACRLIKGDNLHFVLKRCIQIAFPNILHTALEASLNVSERAGVTLPSKATRHRYRLSLDVAIMLMDRKAYESDSKPLIRFGMADSSPQHSRDWLSCRCDAIYVHQLRECFEASNKLIAIRFHREQTRDDNDDDDDPDDEHDLDGEHDRNAEFLASAIRKQDCIPSAMSRGHTTLADKASALLYMWMVMLGHFNLLFAFCSSFFAFTSDMGTEIGLSDFRTVTFKDLLPTWMLPEPEEAQELDLDDDVAAAAPPRPSPVSYQQSWFLENSVPIPGVLHILHNLCKDMHNALRHWPEFWKQLKVMEEFYGDRGWREMCPKNKIALINT